jgi:enamine deaminase RidA (YjgF/YER057c/UK114 family)
MERRNISSGTKWEASAGYSRAVRIGPHVWVAGTTAVDETGRLVGPGDAYVQARYIFQKIERALHEAGATMADVVRTRMFVTDISKQGDVGRAHAQFFLDVKPCATMVGIPALVEAEMLVEIEVEAYVR